MIIPSFSLSKFVCRPTGGSEQTVLLDNRHSPHPPKGRGGVSASIEPVYLPSLGILSLTTTHSSTSNSSSSNNSNKDSNSNRDRAGNRDRDSGHIRSDPLSPALILDPDYRVGKGLIDTPYGRGRDRGRGAAGSVSPLPQDTSPTIRSVTCAQIRSQLRWQDIEPLTSSGTQFDSSKLLLRVSHIPSTKP